MSTTETKTERTLSTRYGGLPRGKCWGKWYAGKTSATGDFEWCEKSGGTLYIPSGPGHLEYGSDDDGFRRVERSTQTYTD